MDLPDRECVFCGTRFKPKRKNHKFCRDRCRKRSWDREQEDKRVQGVKAVIMAMIERIVDEAIHQVYGEGASA